MQLLEILGKIGFDWRMALANLVNFLIIFYLLKKFAFGPLGRMLKERQAKIEKGLADAEKAATDKIMAQEKYRLTLEEARKEANDIVARAHEQGKTILQQASHEAQEKTAIIMQEAKTRLEKEKTMMEHQIESKVVALSITIAEKILGEKVDDTFDAKFIKQINTIATK